MVAPMSDAFVWGLVSQSSLLLGGLFACFVRLGDRALGLIMGFGAGVLVSAVAYELVYEAVHIARLTGYPALGFFGGACTFFFADLLISRMGGRRDGASSAAGKSSLVVAMVLGVILDGIPESVVIGLGILEGGSVSVSMLVAVFISNFPESAAGTTAMRAGGWSRTRILLLWAGINLVCGGSAAAGYALLGGASNEVLASVQAFAGGAILMMLANAMIPEAYEKAGKLAGVSTIFGFAVAVALVIREHGGTL